MPHEAPEPADPVAFEKWEGTANPKVFFVLFGTPKVSYLYICICVYIQIDGLLNSQSAFSQISQISRISCASIV